MIINGISFQQSGTNFYLTANQYYISFTQSPTPQPQYMQMLTVIQNVDCSWSFKTRDGLYISLNPNYGYLMLNEKIGDF
jgi:hypothetical protein